MVRHPQKIRAECLDCCGVGNWMIQKGCEVFSSCSVSFFPSRLTSSPKKFRPAPDRDHDIVIVTILGPSGSDGFPLRITNRAQGGP